MTPEFLECIDKMNQMNGSGSAFLCAICRKLVGKINHSLQDMERRIVAMEQRLKSTELELEAMKEKTGKAVEKTEQVKKMVVVMEKEVEAGMEKAAKEVKEAVRTEMTERKEKAVNVVVYGMAEAATDDIRERKDHDAKKTTEMLAAIEVEKDGEIEVMFRAGKKREDGKPRPMIVRVSSDETREKILLNARKMARKEEWRSVYVAPDLTWQQREEARKKEKEMQDEAAKKMEEAKNEGKTGKFVVIGQRGRNRRLVWREERQEAE